jgi:hypothetical protein
MRGFIVDLRSLVISLALLKVWSVLVVRHHVVAICDSISEPLSSSVCALHSL